MGKVHHLPEVREVGINRFCYDRLAQGDDPDDIARLLKWYCKNDVIHMARRCAEDFRLPMLPVIERKRPYVPRP